MAAPESPAFDLVVQGGVCVTPGGVARADIGIRHGRIAAIGALSEARAVARFDATHLHILPGIIDSQVHFREPGGEHKEDLASGTQSAVAGGVTAVLEMPNTRPATTSAAALADKRRRAGGRAWCDFGFFVGATAENASGLAELEREPACAGVKIFMGSSTGDLLVPDDATLRRVLSSGLRRCAVHAEDERRLVQRRPIAEAAGRVQAHPEWRDDVCARGATERLLRLATATGRLVHVLHISSAGELPLLAAARDLASVEVTPQHLTLAAPECYERLGTRAQMNPPIRGAEHRAALWRAVRDGLVDAIGSDHAPHTIAEKSAPYPQSPSGMPGVQTLLPVMLDHVAAGRLTLERLVDLVAHGPARLYGIAGKGRLARGYDGDLTIVDLRAIRRIESAWLRARCGWSPFEGMRVTGWPVATLLRGGVVMRDGEILGAPAGRPLRFHGVRTAVGDGDQGSRPSPASSSPAR